MKRGVTLLELLVVLAIIAVLAVIGFFGVRAAIAHSHNSADMNSLRQIYAASKLYESNWNGYLAPIRLEKGPSGYKSIEPPVVQLKSSLQPYGTEEELWFSRLDWRRHLSRFDERRFGIGDHADSSYVLSFEHWHLPVNDTEQVYARLYEVLSTNILPDPSRSTFLYDNLHRVGDSPLSKPGPVESIRGPRFLRLMYDGSVQLVPWEKFWEPKGSLGTNRSESTGDRRARWKRTTQG